MKQSILFVIIAFLVGLSAGLLLKPTKIEAPVDLSEILEAIGEMEIQPPAVGFEVNQPDFKDIGKFKGDITLIYNCKDISIKTASDSTQNKRVRSIRMLAPPDTTQTDTVK